MIAQSNPSSFEHLYHVAFHAAGQYVSEADAEDVAQEALLKLCQYMASGRAVNKPVHYLIRIVKNCAINHFRRTAREPTPHELRSDDTPLRAGGPARGPSITDVDRRLDLHALLQHLPPKQRETIQILTRGGSLHAVAKAEGISVASVRRRVQRAVRQLQCWLNDNPFYP